eukprot:1153437-Pelagomonas_calceolata.AAC.3
MLYCSHPSPTHPLLTAPPLSSLLFVLLLAQLQASIQVTLSDLLAVTVHVDELPGTLQSQARAVLGVQLAPS